MQSLKQTTTEAAPKPKHGRHVERTRARAISTAAPHPHTDSCHCPLQRKERQALLLQNEHLVETLRTLSTGLEAGHRDLLTGLQQLLEASATTAPQAENVQTLSQRQLALYIVYLGRAVQVAQQQALDAHQAMSSSGRFGTQFGCCFTAGQVGPPIDQNSYVREHGLLPPYTITSGNESISMSSMPSAASASGIPVPWRWSWKRLRRA